jgi:hypothetical protein
LSSLPAWDLCTLDQSSRASQSKGHQLDVRATAAATNAAAEVKIQGIA